MKKLIIILALSVVTVTLYAQEKRINLYSAYVFDDSFETVNSSTDYYTGKIVGGYQWGVGLEIKPKDEMGIELLYYRQDTQAPVAYYNVGAFSRTLDVSVNYIMLGGNRYFKTGKVEPYGGILLGAVVFNNKNPQPSEETSATRFGLGLRLGVNIWVSDKVAIKLQTQYLSSVQGIGGGFYFGTGGAGAGASTYSTIGQFVIGGGLGFKLGQ